jgi:replicative DNA helicase
MNVLQNRDAEVALIGTALNSQDCARKLADLPGDMFSHPDTIAAHKAVQRLLSRREKVDLITLEAESSKEAETAVMLVNAMQAGYMTSMFGQWLSILDDARKRRAIITTANEAMQAARDPGEKPEKVAAMLSSAGKVAETKAGSIDMTEALAMLLDTFGDQRKACQTGIAGFDRLTGGIRGGKLIVIGARPGVGKTALALSMGKHVAQHTGGVLVVSLEMSEEEIMARLYASESGVDVQELESGKLTDESYATLATCGPLLAALPMRIATRCTTPLQIRREAVRMQENGGLSLVIVDYLQLVRSDGKHSSRYEEVSEISRELKLMAMDLGVPVIALTQFNRSSEAGKNGQASRRAPTMAEAKDSGSIEQDANIFIVQYAPEDAGDDPYAQQALQICKSQGWEWQQLIVEKNRQGRTGKINIGFDKGHMTFQNLDLSGVIR